MTLPEYKTDYKGMVLKMVWYWKKNRLTGYWNRAQKQAYTNTVKWSLRKRAEAIIRSQESLVNKQLWKNWTPTRKRKKKRNRHKPYILHEILLKTDCKPKCRHGKLSDSQKIRENLDDLGFDNEFVDKKPKPQSMKEKKMLDFLKIKSSVLQKTLLTE